MTRQSWQDSVLILSIFLVTMILHEVGHAIYFLNLNMPIEFKATLVTLSVSTTVPIDWVCPTLSPEFIGATEYYDSGVYDMERRIVKAVTGVLG